MGKMRPSVQVKEYETKHLLNSVRIDIKTINVNCLLLKNQLFAHTKHVMHTVQTDF